MIALISPAKTLDFETKTVGEHTFPRFPKETKELVSVLQQQSSADLKSLMSISENIADLNVGRYKGFKATHNEKNAKTCLHAFKGDVYLGLEAETLDHKALDFSQQHLRILSGLYGLLRPLDLIQPYRLEMGTRLVFDQHKNLYSYWDDKIVKMLHKDLKAQDDNVVINLASNEYFKAVDRKSLKAQVIDTEFKDHKNGQYKLISFFAKRARGLMARYIIDHQITNVEDLKAFDYDGYFFDPKDSTDTKLAFKRG
ncbi:hypothetical protein SAMN04488028_101342 [Reichenbachiella agariperforans]|uniref:UPF0246 protein SAMN04488028_101342 n=1 Tax=Reichenbachiella agariperforans TaxID=156994 RepID=A0A1M6JW32_REIAG|nr:peroxide stress protein YaaA [Reichenbachiella agariperforans]SHJ50863.1 hypothetical protein SAMN04488028_101342 [Reichenbachiella agariperforans]